MNSSYNQNYKPNNQTSPRFNQRSQDFNLQKPKPRQSQPPLMSQDPDFFTQYIKSSSKDNLNNLSKNYKNYDLRYDTSNNKNNYNNYNNLQNQMAQKSCDNRLQTNQSTQPKFYQQFSPKNQAINWQNNKYTNNIKNQSMSPTASNSQIQNYQINQKKIQPRLDNFITKNSMNSQNPTSPKKQVVTQKNQYSNTFQYVKKEMMLDQGNKSPIQTLPIKKSPRFSEPGLFSVNNQQQNKNMGQYQNKSKFQDETSMRSYNTASQYQSKYTNKYSTSPTAYESRINQASKSQFLRKQKQIKQNITNSNYMTKMKLKLEQKPLLKISDFQKGKQLGNGKFGTVYIVRHKKTGFICAMKSIPKKMIKQQNIINQFIRQIKIQTYLDHPNITKLYGFFDDIQNIYLLLELSSQGQLYQVLKERKKLTQKTVIYIMKQLCEAIKYLHSQNIIHRDIKPQNIVLQYGTIKLCDFGWAVCRGGQLRSTFCGTPLYVSPQILKGQLYDQKIDIWSIGILTYELIIGEIPFEITTQEQLIKIIKQQIVFPVSSDISETPKDFILKILRKNPDERLKIGKLLQHPFLQQQVELTEIQL